MTDIYLDYAATSAIRPEVVVEAVAAYLRDTGATPGRAGHRREDSTARCSLQGGSVGCAGSGLVHRPVFAPVGDA